MSDELRNKLVGELKEIQSKYTYFLMAAAGASLGFGVQKLEGQAPGQFLWLGLSGMALWMLSFAFGCMVIASLQGLVVTNIDLVAKVRKSDLDGAIAVDTRSRLQMRRFECYHLCQLVTLAAGAVIFAAWRVLLIFHPTYLSPCIP